MGGGGSSGPSQEDLDQANHEKEAAIQAQKDMQFKAAIKHEEDKAERDRMALKLQHDLQKNKSDAEHKLMEQELRHNREQHLEAQLRMDAQMDASKEQIQLLRDSMRKGDDQMKFIMEQHREDMAAYKAQNAASMEQLTATILALNQENVSYVYDESKPDGYNDLEKENFSKFCKAAADHLKGVPKMPKKSLAMLGPSGVGKSTLINAFAGKAVAAVGLEECTDNISMVHGEGPYDFYDVPGSHDARADFYKVDKLTKLKSVHMVIVVYESRIDHCAKVAKLMQSIDIPFICVRNKCALDDPQFTQEQWKQCFDTEMKKLQMYCPGDYPLIFLGLSTDTANGARMKNFENLQGVVDAAMATL